MKEAAGELNMTIIVIIAVGAILAFLTIFLPDIFNNIRDKWGNENNTTIPTSYIEHVDLEYFI